MPTSEPAPRSTSANAPAPKARRTRSVIKRSSTRRKSRRLKNRSPPEDEMQLDVRDSWKYEKGGAIQVTEALLSQNPTIEPIPSADADSPTVPTMNYVHGVDDEATKLLPKLLGKQRILIIGTGGTIAGRGSSPTHSAGYDPGVVDVRDLIEAVPSLKDVAEVKTSQHCTVGSPDLTSEMLIDLAQKVQNELDKDEIDAVVITHGTDTLEETSFFLDLTVDSSKPVIVTGAMYPSTSYSADGPKNLYEAVCVGASPASQNRGVLVVFNGVIMPARYTVKSDANMIATFDPGHQGCLGQVVDDKTLYYWPPARPLGHQHIDIRSLDPKAGFPKVEIVYGRLGVDPGVFEAHVQSGAKGLVLVGMGAGCWSSAGRDQLNEHIGPGRISDRESSKPSIPVVTSFRAGRGCVSLKKHIFGVPDWVIRAGFLNPPKACKLLEVCLALDMPYHKIEAAFGLDAGSV